MNIKAPFIHIAILIAFLVNTFGPLPLAQAQASPAIGGEFRLPAPGVRVGLSPEFNPPILKGIKVHPDNPFRFDFILDQGSSPLFYKEGIEGSSLKKESTRLIKYFLASLTIPEKDLWVNLSPYEKDRIIPNSFGLTEMGRDLLAEDYMLKQITASLIYPEGEVGKKFWKRVYEESAKKFGTTNIPVNTFNKVWIVPEKAVVYENAKAGTAYVVESKLKVMLEQDYLSLKKHADVSPSLFKEGVRGSLKDSSALGSQIVREIVIPELTKEVNEGKNFAQLRQVYNSLILATWYKKKIKDSILAQVYADRNKVAGVGYKNSPPEAIYQRYLQAFKKGVYNYIKEEPDPITQETIPRKYFSGGVEAMGLNDLIDIKQVNDKAMINILNPLREALKIIYARIVPSEASRPDVARNKVIFDGEREIIFINMRQDSPFDRNTINVLLPIIRKTISHENQGGMKGEITVEKLARQFVRDVFLMSLDGHKYIIKISLKEQFNKYIENDWQILTELNSDSSHTDIAVPIITGEEPALNQSSIVPQRLSFLVTSYFPWQNFTGFLEKQGTLNDLGAINFGIALSHLVGLIHKKGVIIRDLTPGNIMIRSDGAVALYDFDVSMPPSYDWRKDARGLKETAAHGYSEDGMLYLANPKDVYSRERPDIMSDIYSIGMNIFFASVGKHYDDGQYGTKVGLEQVKNKQLRTIIGRAIGSRERRYKNTVELIADLEKSQQEGEQKSGDNAQLAAKKVMSKENVRKLPEKKRVGRGHRWEWDKVVLDQVDQHFDEWVQKGQMDPGDFQILRQILLGDEEILKDLLREYRLKVAIKAEDKDKPDENGRTVYLKLKKSFPSPHGDITVLRIKGARPRYKENPAVIKSHTGSGFSEVPVEVSKSGNRIIKKAPRWNPQGALLKERADMEYHLMEEGIAGLGFETDYPMAKGSWKNKTHEGRPIGFIIAGMRADDVRIAIDLTADLNNFMFNVVTDKTLKTNPKMTEEIYRKIGQSIRAYHDAGYFHRSPHIGNLGVEIGKNSEVRVVLRDLDATITLDSILNGNSRRIQATYRLLDLGRIISDLSFGASVLGMWSYEKVFQNIKPLIKSFLAGYFHENEISSTSLEFEKLFKDATSTDFPGIVRSLKTIDKIILDKNTPVYGNLWGRLYDLSRDQVMNIQKNGGIDLTPANMNLQTQNAGEGIKFHLDPAQLAQLQNAPGFVPVIIYIQPLENLKQFLGIDATNSFQLTRQ